MKPLYYLAAGAILLLALLALLIIRIRRKIRVSLQQAQQCRAPILTPEGAMGAIEQACPQGEAGIITREEGEGR
jgi:hypothetical protein